MIMVVNFPGSKYGDFTFDAMHQNLYDIILCTVFIYLALTKHESSMEPRFFMLLYYMVSFLNTYLFTLCVNAVNHWQT